MIFIKNHIKQSSPAIDAKLSIFHLWLPEPTSVANTGTECVDELLTADGTDATPGNSHSHADESKCEDEMRGQQ